MSSALLRDLAVVLTVAAGTTLLCRALRQPVVIGYLLAGLIIGPHTPPFKLVHDLHSIHTMAELGLVVLMFVLGLEFNLPKLKKVGPKAALATVLEVVGMMGIGYATGRWLGWTQHDSIYLAAILSISSTTIIIKVLSDLKLTHEEFAQAVFGILILEDIAAVMILTVLSGLGIRQETEGLTLVRAVAGVGFFVTLFLVLGLALIPRLLRWVARFRSSEMTGLVAFGLCLASALLAEYFGYSVALGAFLIGAVIGVSSEAEHIETWIHPIRDLFSALFFVSAGLLIDPQLLWDIKGPVVLITALTVGGQIFMGAIGSFLAGYSLNTSFRIGITLAQIGEFSFVFASMGLRTGLGSPFLYPMAVAVSALTTLFTPYLIRHSDGIVAALLRLAPGSWTASLEQFQQKRQHERPASQGVEVMSRYLGRMAIYAVLLTAGFLLTASVNRHILAHAQVSPGVYLALWVTSWIIQLPLIHAVAGYINHFLLLTLTELAVRSPASALFQKVPIQRTYEFVEGLLFMLLAVVWVIQAPVVDKSNATVFGALGFMALVAWSLKKTVRVVYEKAEELLDEVVGLASSEPLRRAAISVEGPHSLLNELIQRVLVNKRSPAAHQSLRDLRLRERSGTSVIGIYREGALNANPSPETILLPNDILVVLGTADQCRQAQQFLRGGK